MYRRTPTLEVLLVHPGGPFWAKKDEGAWSIPKGEVSAGEDRLEAAKREFAEELGFEADGPFEPLGSVRQKAGKVVHAWACPGDADLRAVRSNRVEIEWPPRSGRRLQIPEVDRAEYFPIELALKKINPAQADFLHALSARPTRSE